MMLCSSYNDYDTKILSFGTSTLKKTKSFEECGLLIQKIEIKVLHKHLKMKQENVEKSDFPGIWLSAVGTSLFGNILEGKEVKAMKQGR